METEHDLNKLLRKHQNTYINQLLLCLPETYIKKHALQHNNYEKIVSVLQAMCKDHRVDEDCSQFFREIGIDKKVWAKIDSSEEKYAFIVKNLDKCIEEGQKKVSTQIDNFVNSTRKSVTPSNKENRRKDPFQWLKLKNKYPMCEQKLKAKLVQAISDIKNEKRIRDRIADPENLPKVSLLDQSLVMDEYQKMKIDYEWTDQDERLFLNNIKLLKQKFNKSQFLKTCSRFKFISQHEIQTLAAEQISRKLDHNNKVFLSREFLLDKYYSNKDFLTEQEMRFILKTSPLLSKCVDKQFIRNAIKNIDYEDINRLELKIAENIISRFDQIRKAVRDSRKCYKQNQNQVIKERIVEFEQKQEMEIAKQIARQQLKKHKINYKKNSNSKSSLNVPMNLETKKIYQPLNQYHPPCGLFVKDCNQQCTDDLFNSYELNYIQRDKNSQLDKKGLRNSVSMMQFYTGGLQTKSSGIPDEVLQRICKVIKAHHYEKELKIALQNYEPQKLSQGTCRTGKSGKSLTKQTSCYDLERKQKSVYKIPDQSSEAQIKRKILQNKQRAKGVVYLNKLLSLAAQNSYASFKALNAKLTAQQVNTKDHKGNTALYYATKHQNFEFMNHLLNLGANPSIVCQKGFTPLHFIFKTNNVNLIIRCLCTAKTPNLNVVNNEGKTPLAYCTHDVLTRLNLQDGVVQVENRKAEFDNNALLSGQRMDRLRQRGEQQHLGVRGGF